MCMVKPSNSVLHHVCHGQVLQLCLRAPRDASVCCAAAHNSCRLPGALRLTHCRGRNVLISTVAREEN